MKPNIRLFFPGQHRGDWTGYCGADVRTPNLDGLAARGQVFTNASPLCSPARARLASAKPYDAQSVRHNQHDVDPEEANIYQALQDAGYAVLERRLHADRTQRRPDLISCRTTTTSPS